MFSTIGLERKRIWQIIAVTGLLISLLLVQTVAAHPLGNFSINRYSRLELNGDTVALRYIVDMAEIPALQNRPKIDTNNDDTLSDSELATYIANLIPQLTANLDLSIDDQPIKLTVSEYSLSFPEGQGGLLTQRLVIDFEGVLPTQRGEIFYADGNYVDRLGWSEIVVDSADAFSVDGATVPMGDISAELTAYPDDLLQSPLAETSIVFSLAPPAGAAQTSTDPAAAPAVGATTIDRYDSSDRFAELITIEELTPRIIIVALLLAFGLGAAHALTPGHGKTIVGAYLVGSRGTPKHALFLGLTTTITHTAGVFFFGLLVLFASRFIVPEDLFPWLGVMSGLLVVLIGASLARVQWQKRTGTATDPHDRPEDYHTHFGIGHSHVPNNDAPSFGSLLALGVSGGLIPCPSALVVLLSAIALQRVGFGLVLILVFSIGLATVLTLLGIIFVVAGKRLEGVAQSNGRLLHTLPVVSACFVTLAGVGITYQALLQTGLFS